MKRIASIVSCAFLMFCTNSVVATTYNEMGTTENTISSMFIIVTGLSLTIFVGLLYLNDRRNRDKDNKES